MKKNNQPAILSPVQHPITQLPRYFNISQAIQPVMHWFKTLQCSFSVSTGEQKITKS